MPNLGQIPPEQLEREVITYCDEVYNEAEVELGESHESKLASRLIDYIHGKQWNVKARHGRSRPVVNRLFRHFIEMTGLLADIEMDFEIKFPSHDQGEFDPLEKLMNRMIVDWADMTDFEMELSQVIMYGLLHSGPVKMQWNPFMNGGMGDNEMVVLSPLNFMTLGAVNKLSQAEVCIVRQPVTLEELIRRHGDVARGCKPDPALSELPGDTVRPARFSKARWANYSQPLKNLLGQRTPGKQSRYPRLMRKEFWLKDDTQWEGKESIVVGPLDRDGKPATNWCYRVEPGMKLYPRGRVIVVAGGKVLEDQCSPYWHARMPFALYRPFRVPWQLAGLSPLEPLAAMQAIYNRVFGGMLDTVNDALEPKVIGPKAAFAQQDWDALDPGQPGSKLVYNNNAVREPRFADPRVMPQYVPDFKNDLTKEMDMTSQSSAIQQAMNKKQVPGSDSLEMIISSRSTNLRLMAKNEKSFINDVGQLGASNMMQFYGIRLRVAKYGEQGILPQDLTPWYGQMLPKGIEPEDFVRHSSFKIKPGTLLGIQKPERIQMAFALRKNGDLSRHNLFRVIGENFDMKKNDEELKAELAEKALIAQAAQAMGGGPHKGKAK